MLIIIDEKKTKTQQQQQQIDICNIDTNQIIIINK